MIKGNSSREVVSTPYQYFSKHFLKLLLLFVFLGGLFITSVIQVDAVSGSNRKHTSASGRPASMITANITTSKDTYIVGESIIVTSIVASDDTPVVPAIGLTVRTRIALDGFAGTWNDIINTTANRVMLTSGISGTKVFPAPSSPGTYSACFVSNIGGDYNSPKYTCEPYTVVDCNGSVPANASRYNTDGNYDRVGMTSSVPTTHSLTNTAQNCQFSCNTGYNWDGFACVSTASPASCVGSVPSNASPHNTDGDSDRTGLTVDTNKSYSPTDTAAKCQFYCATGYNWNSGSRTCVPPVVSGGVCTGSRPGGTTYSSGDSSPAVNTPWTYRSPNTSEKCEYRCLSTYTWDPLAGVCVPPTPPPDPPKCNGSLPPLYYGYAPGENFPSVDGVWTYRPSDSPAECEFKCQTGYNYDPVGNTCDPSGPSNSCDTATAGNSFDTAPSSNLCTNGSASVVSGPGPWTWTCSGGTSPTVSCSAGINSPDRPVNLIASAGGCGTTDVNLTWDPAARATSYTVKRNNIVVATVSGLSYTDIAPAAGVTYSYTVRANGAGGSSPDSVVVTASAPSSCAVDIAVVDTSSIPGSATYNNITGRYDSITTSLRVKNEGPGDYSSVDGNITISAILKASPLYRVLSDDPISDGPFTGSLTAGSRSGLYTQTFTDVPFGIHKFCTMVNKTPKNYSLELAANMVNNENCSDRTLDIQEPPIFIDADRDLIRAGQTVRIDWGAETSYPMQCEVTGSGGVSDSFDASDNQPSPYDGSSNPVTDYKDVNLSNTSIFTIICTEPSTGESFTKEKTVEVVPGFEEV